MDYFFDLLQSENKISLDEYLKTHDINEEHQGQTLLYWSVYHRNLDFVKNLVEKGADFNKPDKHGRTPISTACYFGFVEIVEYLLTLQGINTKACWERAQRGWDRHEQTEILDLLKTYRINKLKKRLHKYIPQSDSKLGQLNVMREMLIIMISSKFYPADAVVPEKIVKKIAEIRSPEKCVKLCEKLVFLPDEDIQSLEQVTTNFD